MQKKSYIVLTNHTLGTSYSAAISNENSHPWSPPQRDFIPRKKNIAMVLMACSSLRYKSGCTCWFDLTKRNAGKKEESFHGWIVMDCLSLLLSPTVIFFMKFAGQFAAQKTAVLWKKKFSNKSARQFGQKIWPYHRWTSHRPPLVNLGDSKVTPSRWPSDISNDGSVIPPPFKTVISPCWKKKLW